jgi:hypothetical protein
MRTTITKTSRRKAKPIRIFVIVTLQFNAFPPIFWA